MQVEISYTLHRTAHVEMTQVKMRAAVQDGIDLKTDQFELGQWSVEHLKRTNSIHDIDDDWSVSDIEVSAADAMAYGEAPQWFYDEFVDPQTDEFKDPRKQ